MNDPAVKNKWSCRTLKRCLVRFAYIFVFVIPIALVVTLISSCDSTNPPNDLNEAEEKNYFESKMVFLLCYEADSDGNAVKKRDCPDLKIKYRSPKCKTYESGWEWSVEGTYSSETLKDKGTFVVVHKTSKTEFGTTHYRTVEMKNGKGSVWTSVDSKTTN